MGSKAGFLGEMLAVDRKLSSTPNLSSGNHITRRADMRKFHGATPPPRAGRPGPGTNRPPGARPGRKVPPPPQAPPRASRRIPASIARRMYPPGRRMTAQ